LLDFSFWVKWGGEIWQVEESTKMKATISDEIIRNE
jgi:hypothetical protein